MAETLAYRLHSTAYLASDSTGALRAPGRWHSLGTRVVYAAEHASLALLETLVHAAGRKLPPRSLTHIRIPSAVEIEVAAWLDHPQSSLFGDAWVASQRSAVLRVPSAVVNGLESNFVFNPAHPKFAQIHFSEPEPFTTDARFVVFP